MIVEKTKLDGVLLIKPEIFEDHRGEYVELYNKKLYSEMISTKIGYDIQFVEDDISVSSKYVLRGIHGNADTWKLISCLDGKFYLVVLCYDEQSKDFGKWQYFLLSDRNRYQVLIPPKYGNGHLVLSNQAIFYYKQSTYYDPKSQFTIRYDDPRFNIWWPIRDPILSIRDEISR